MPSPSLRCACGYCMRLPYPRFPQVKPSQWAQARKGILSLEVGCPQCGRASLYTTRDVRWDTPVPEGGAGHGAICWRIETGCDEQLCDLPVEFHLLTHWHTRAEEIRLLMLRLLERGFFKKLKCGRGHSPGSGRIRAVRRVA